MLHARDHEQRSWRKQFHFHFENSSDGYASQAASRHVQVLYSKSLYDTVTSSAINMMAIFMVYALLSWLSAITNVCDGFQSTVIHRIPQERVLLQVKKKRRRRKDADLGTVEEPDAFADSTDLPEFDLDHGDEKIQAAPAQPFSSNTDEITASMIGSSEQTVRSIDDLIADRELEALFEFDESEADPSIPDLVTIIRGQPVESSGARKRARREAAIARDAAAASEDGQNILKNIPFLLGEDGEVKPNKILEAGAWAGIGLLVLWEIYINSPFFERAAPMAPVVY